MGLNMKSIVSKSGILRLAEIALCLLTGILSSAAILKFTGGAGFLQFSSWIGFLIALALLGLFLSGLIHKIKTKKWYFIETIIAASLAGLLFLSSLIVACKWGRYDKTLAAASFFGFCACAVWAVDAYLKWKMHKGGEMPGEEE